MKFGLRTPAGERVYLTDHALERYGERVRPHLQAPQDLQVDAQRLVKACGVLSEAAPEWANCNWEAEAREPAAWLVCGDVAFVVEVDGKGRRVALTTITRGGISDQARRERNARRSAKRYARRKRNSAMERALGGRPRHLPALEES